MQQAPKLKRAFVVCLFAITLASAAFAERIKILTFNILGRQYGHTETNEEWIGSISSIIKDSEASIVLLQEVGKEAVLERLLEKLGERNWEYCYSPKTASCPINLTNAVLYDHNKVLTSRGDVFHSDFSSQYPFEKGNTQVIAFSPVNERRLSFLLVNVHLSFNNKREEDFKSLETLYAQQKWLYDTVIIGGDFNKPWRELKASNLADAVIDGPNWKFDNSPLWTTLGKNGKKAKGISLANDYDHFVIKEGLVRLVEGSKHPFAGRSNKTFKSIAAGEATYTDNNSYHKGVSDHLPVVITVEF